MALNVKIIYPKDTIGYKMDAQLYQKILPGAKIVYLKDLQNKQIYSLVNLHLCHVPNIQVIKSARYNIIMINHELGDAYYSKHNTLISKMDIVLCKTQVAVDILTKLKQKHGFGYEVWLTRHTTNFPEFNKDIILDKDPNLVVHTAGWHPWKQTNKILNTWIRYPDLPKIVVICTEFCLKNVYRFFEEDIPDGDVKGFPKNLPKNIEFITSPLSWDDLVILKHRAAIHMCPSLMEGYGHYINEGRICKSITITSDYPPMNELIDTKSGILVKCLSFYERPHGARACVTSELEMYNAVIKAQNMTNKEKIDMGNEAFNQYLAEKKYWEKSMLKLNNWINDKAKIANLSRIHCIRSQYGGDDLVAHMQEGIRSRIKNDLKPFRFRPEEFHKMQAAMLSTSVLKDSIMCVQIKDGIVSGRNVQSPIEVKKFNIKEHRGEVILDLIIKSIDYMKTIGKIAPNCIMYIMTGDTYPYQFQDLPFFCITKPEKRNGILIPDNTFLRHPPNANDNNIEGGAMDWDTTKKKAYEYCKTKSYKKNVIYFKGANTTKHRHDIRGIFSRLKNENLPLQINLDSSYTPSWEFCNYKYLLNLPGNQPWSFRKKFLLMLPSLVIDIVVMPYYDSDHPGEWVNFFDNLFIPNNDYVRIAIEWNGSKLKPLDKSSQETLIREITNTYNKYENNPALYEKIVKSANNKIELLNQHLIYRSIFSLITHYAKRVEEDGGIISFDAL
jgi:hypothetical protein